MINDLGGGGCFGRFVALLGGAVFLHGMNMYEVHGIASFLQPGKKFVIVEFRFAAAS